MPVANYRFMVNVAAKFFQASLGVQLDSSS